MLNFKWLKWKLKYSLDNNGLSFNDSCVKPVKLFSNSCILLLHPTFLYFYSDTLRDCSKRFEVTESTASTASCSVGGPNWARLSNLFLKIEEKSTDKDHWFDMSIRDLTWATVATKLATLPPIFGGLICLSCPLVCVLLSTYCVWPTSLGQPSLEKILKWIIY